MLDSYKMAVEKSMREHKFDEDQFPALGSQAERNAPIKPNKQALKDALYEHEIQSDAKEERRKNIIIFNAPEPVSQIDHEDVDEQRKLRANDKREQDKTLIIDLLKHVVPHRDAKDIKYSRLGTFDAEKSGNRPLRITLDSNLSQKEVMENAKKLKDAPTPIMKKLSLCYDMTETERNHAKKLQKEASDKTKNSTTHVFKVRGPPGKMEIVRFLKRQ